MRKTLTSLIGIFLLLATALGQRGRTDTATGFKACSLPVRYSVNDVFLKDGIGKSYSSPETNPTFIGDVDELKKYFVANPLTDERAKDIVFRVHIGFLVNCKGQYGNLIIVSKGKGAQEILALQVLAIAEKMPQQWLAAMVENKPVDCYQVLLFTVVNGALDKLLYRK